MPEPGGRRHAPAIALGVLGLVSLATASLGGEWLGAAPRAWLLFSGFLAIAIGLAVAPRRHFAPIAIAVIFVLYGGVSALVAIPETPEAAAENAETLTRDQVRASIPAEGYSVQIDDDSFAYAAKVTSLAGFCAILAALLVLLRRPAGGGDRRRATLANANRLEWAGRGLVAAGFLGVGIALARFLLTQLPTDDLWQSAKSMWVGGSYFLVLATFAVPGFGLWLQGLLARGAWGRSLLPLGGAMALYLLLLVPTGQRGFVVALGLMVLAVLVFNKRMSAWAFAAVVALGIVGIGATQAARNLIGDTGGFSASAYVERIAPDQWRELYGSQLASFNWTALIDENREELEIPNSFTRALLKPIPRQIYESKSQGFGTEFTERVFPEAAEQQVSFATPLTAETDYFYGGLGVALVFGLVGALAGLAEGRILRTTPRIIWPVALAAVAWTFFVLMRGDLANALVVSAGWLIPLALVSRAIGLRPAAPAKEILVDALQVAPEFSGIGRRIAELGRDFRDHPPGLPLRVRCARDVEEGLREAFPADTAFTTPLRSSRPRLVRVAYQQLLAPLRDSASTLLVCPGDQAPVWGRAPLLFIVHDVRRISMPETAGSRLEHFYYRLVIRAGVMRAAAILTISRFSRSEIERLYAPEVPVGTITSEVAVRPVAGPQDPDPASLLAVGALRPYKGLETVIEALAMLKERGGPPPHVVCVGADEAGGGYEERLRELAAASGVNDLFELRGWVSDESLGQLQAQSTAVISASEYEGYGLPVAEGLAAGLPVIASSIPPHHEIAGNAAVYFEPGDPAALASAMSRLLERPDLRAQLREQGLRRAAELGEDSRSWAEAIAEVAASLRAPQLAGRTRAGFPEEAAARAESPTAG